VEGPIFRPFTYIKKQAWISCYLSGGFLPMCMVVIKGGRKEKKN
jgi:hypothetical protein